MRRMRISRIIPVLKRFESCDLLDVGCGWEARLLRDVESYIGTGVGIDFKAPEIKTGKISTFSQRIHDTLPFQDESFDVVTMLAVLEHLDEPMAVLGEIRRVLRNGGLLAGTVPSVTSKPVLEFLAYRLGVVNPVEIRDHKAYYNKKSLAALFATAGFVDFHHSYFQLGFNNFFIVRK